MRVEEPEWERSIAVEEFETFVREQEGRSVDDVHEQHISEGLRLLAVALDDVAERTLLARLESEERAMPGAPPQPGVAPPPTVEEEVLQRDLPRDEDSEEWSKGQPLGDLDTQPGSEMQAGELQDQPDRQQPNDPLAPQRVDPGYHLWISDMIEYIDRWEAGVPDHPRPNDLAITAYNNGYLVMRFLKERYYVTDVQLRNSVDQVEAAVNVINAELPLTEQEAATHTYFLRAFDVVDRMERFIGLDPGEVPLPEVEVEGDPDVPAQPQT